jgi:hypothetical protein
MTEVNSAESYYQYRAESDAKIRSMSDEISRLQTDMFEGKLAAAIDRQVPDPDVSNLIFKLVSNSARDTDNGISIGDRSLPEAIEEIRGNESLKRFFSGADIPVPAPQRQFKNWFDE